MVMGFVGTFEHDLDKVTCCYFQSTSKEINWHQTFLTYMHGLQSVILAIFQRGLGCPCIIEFEKFFLFWDADEYLEILEGRIRKCLFFYVKIF